MSINLRNENYWYTNRRDSGPKRVAYLMADGSFEWFNYPTDYNRWRDFDKESIVAMWRPIQYLDKVTNHGDNWSVEYMGPRGWAVYEYYPDMKDLTVKNMLARKALREVIEADIQKDPVALLERALKSHDWYYFYSDAPGSYNAGSASADRINELMKKVDKYVAIGLWNKYCAWAKEEPMTEEIYNKRFS
jgi:hypothetical protein